ncbi:hypothetical protein SLI_3403 [Streptomyces lividans 1326]|uniref:Uncharacterized protein n=1 Tax=Streptomyces lividans 1326 TaxID=1200984 RepID=A0A7U9HCU6_STRLI|nr:hypothetical protein SLI_3403 [Streptomyces lividans 1326]
MHDHLVGPRSMGLRTSTARGNSRVRDKHGGPLRRHSLPPWHGDHERITTFTTRTQRRRVRGRRGGRAGGPDDAGSAEAQSAEPASTALCPSARPAGR